MCKSINLYHFLLLIIGFPISVGCKKMVEIKPPKNTITTEQIFSSNTQAEWALSAVYSKLTNGPMDKTITIATSNFSSGLATILGGLSSDEMYNTKGAQEQDFYYVSTNKLSLTTSSRTDMLWKSAYKIIYDANAVIEGIAGSKPGVLLDSIKQQLTGEALAIRAFIYFNLINYFGDVPLVLTIDFNKTIAMERTPVAKVYEQIVRDLKDARAVLPEDFSAGKNEKVRVNKWFAEALLARVYLYMGQYTDAINSATTVLNRTDLFKLENNLEDVFKKESKEAIFQLKPNAANSITRSATPEGFTLAPANVNALASYQFFPDFVNSFAASDKRKTAWMNTGSMGSAPFKYKQGNHNSPLNGPVLEYYVVMRLAELYLIRAEAKLLLSDANKDAAIADLNALRPRTGLGNFPNSLTAEEVKTAIANERKFELFAEWGHRWFDLKRTGKAEEVLSAMAEKKPWAGDYQLLYPIPLSEIDNNRFISQNPDYNK